MPHDRTQKNRPTIWDEALLEELSAVEHERWAHWQQYLHSKCLPGPNGALVIPAELVTRWTEQISTPYEQLSEKERISDREQVQTYLKVIGKHLSADGSGQVVAGDAGDGGVTSRD